MATEARQDLRLRPALVLAAILALVLALLAGCGDDNGDSGSEAAGSAGNGGAAENASSESPAGEDAQSGEDSNSTVLSDKQISKAAFVKQANKICEATVAAVLGKVGPKLEGVFDRPEKERKELEAKLLKTVTVPELRSEVDEIRELGTPPGDGEEIEKALAAILRLVDELETNPEALAGSPQLFERATRPADAYGLESCPYG